MRFNIIGNEDNITFAARIFNASSFIGGCIGIVSILLNQLGDYPNSFNYWLGFTSFNFLLLYYLSRFLKKNRYLRIPFLINICIVIFVAWVFNEGIYGSTVFFFGYSFLGIPFIFQKNRLHALAVIFVFAIIMILIQVFHPQLIRHYPNEVDQLIDISAVMLTMLILSAYTVMLFINYMKEEQTIIEKQKKEIQEQAGVLKTINSKLVELDKFKELMVGMVIHDLKNPLNSIIGLSNQNNPERNIKLICQSSRQMLNLVQTILDVQKFDTTELKLNCENVVLNNLLINVLDNISGVVEEKNIQINIRGNSGFNVWIDAQLMERVFLNILGNAIKYSDNNAEIIILIRDESPHIKVTITDYGQGIEPENQHKVFDRYAQISSLNSGKLRSTGLGLAFCKMVITAHGCRIGVHSKPGQFTSFWFTLNKSAQLPEMIHNENEIKMKKSALTLTDADKKYLAGFVIEMGKYKYYEIGKLTEILNQIDDKMSNNIAVWKSEMERTVFANNEDLFDELLRNFRS